MRNAIVFLALALFLAACAAPAKPTPASASAGIPVPSTAPSDTPQPSPSPSPLPTDTLAPTATLIPTGVPSNTAIALPSFTPFIFTLPTLTPTGPATSEFDCQVLNQSVADGTAFDPNERFSVGWRVLNSGSATWYPASIVFGYVGGSKMYQYSPVTLKTTVQPGQVTVLGADMRAPKNSTFYTSSWGLRQGTQVFCIVRVTIWVNSPATPTP